MVCPLPRRDRRASGSADARDHCRLHQPTNPLPADREAIGLHLGVNTRRAIGSMPSGVDRADMRVRSASVVARAEAGRLRQAQ